MDRTFVLFSFILIELDILNEPTLNINALAIYIVKEQIAWMTEKCHAMQRHAIGTT